MTSHLSAEEYTKGGCVKGHPKHVAQELDIIGS